MPHSCYRQQPRQHKQPSNDKSFILSPFFPRNFECIGKPYSCKHRRSKAKDHHHTCRRAEFIEKRELKKETIEKKMVAKRECKCKKRHSCE